LQFNWAKSLKFKIVLVFAIGLGVAFSINLIIAIKTIHSQKEEDVEKVLTHLLVESNDEYIHSVLTPSSDLNFLYSIPHNIMIISDSEVNQLRFIILTNPYRTNNRFVAASIKLSNNYYLNAISDHEKIDTATYKYAQLLLLRYGISLVVILFIVIIALDYYMRPLEQLVVKTKMWKREAPLDFVLDDASTEIKEVSSAFAVLVKRLESYRLKETELFKEAAHELKTPLALMRSRLDVYEQSDQYEKNKFISELSKDLDRLTTELKSVLFLESSDFEESTKIDIQSMLQEIKEKIEILIVRKQLKINISKNTFNVFASKKLIYKIFGALIENATTYAMERSHININIDPNHRSIQITNRVGNDKYLFSSKMGSKMLSRLSPEIGYDFKIEDIEGMYSITIIFNQLLDDSVSVA
jgi:signal transduction histidine kinase